MQLSSNPFSIRITPPKVISLPAWVPPAGFFADVPMLNNPQDVTPAIYRRTPTDSSYMNNPFELWGGSAILRDYSALGAQVYYSGGHESSYATMPNVQFSLICDFSTLLWSTANVPDAPNQAKDFKMGLAADGSSYCPHSYLGLQEFPTAWGGGPKGSLASFFWSAATGYWVTGAPLWENRINLLDVSKTRLGYTQLATRQPENIDPTKIRFRKTEQGGAYPITVMDTERQGWWASTTGAVHYTLFVHRSGTITQYPALGGNLANGALALCPSLNLLIAIDGGYSVGSHATNAYRTLHIRNLATGAVTSSLTLGTVPGLGPGYDGVPKCFNCPDKLGLQWVEELGCIVGLDQLATPPVVVKLTPPKANAATEQWTWSSVPLQHWSGDPSGQSTLQVSVNAGWSKFRWVPSLHAFVYGTAKNRKPQVVRIA